MKYFDILGGNTHPTLFSVSQVFQKGSPLVNDISEAILQFAESGRLGQLEKGIFSSNCSSSNDLDQDPSIGPGPFCSLFSITGGIAISAFIITMFRQLRNRRRVSSFMESITSAREIVAPSYGTSELQCQGGNSTLKTDTQLEMCQT